MNAHRGQGSHYRQQKDSNQQLQRGKKQADTEKPCCSWQDKHKPPSQSQQGEGVYMLHLFYCSYTSLFTGLQSSNI